MFFEEIRIFPQVAFEYLSTCNFTNKKSHKNIVKSYLDKKVPKRRIYLYSQVPIKRVGHNKRAGWIFLKKLINVQGYSVPNKRVGWNFSENFTNV